MRNSRLANLAGAFALVAADAQRDAAAEAAGHGAAAPAALTTILAFPGLSIDRLRRAVGLTHSGGVRLVNRLEAAGLVRRRAAPDGRVAALELTPAGTRRAERTLARREAALRDLLGPLTDPERALLASLLERLLEPLPANLEDLQHICRLCDYWTCDGSALACPVGRGARARRDASRS